MWRLLQFTIPILISINVVEIKSYTEPRLNVNDTTNCEEFGKFARFNPYSVLSDWWMAFYYWGPAQPTLHFKFRVPTPVDITYLKTLLAGHVLEPINWTAPIVLMQERNNLTHLMVEQGKRGEYLCYTPFSNLKPDEIIEATEVRFKQTDNGRYLGFMVCENSNVYALARFKDIPRKKDIQDVAAKIGFKGRGGKSYLYQGHEWMPIPEADDDDLWRPGDERRD